MICVGVFFIRRHEKRRSNWTWKLVNLNSYKHWQGVSANRNKTVPVRHPVYVYLYTLFTFYTYFCPGANHYVTAALVLHCGKFSGDSKQTVWAFLFSFMICVFIIIFLTLAGWMHENGFPATFSSRFILPTFLFFLIFQASRCIIYVK